MASNTVIRTNVLALNSHRNLGLVGLQKETSSKRLSSGYRINSAADDAAGLAISEKMRAQIRGLDMANKNTQDAISLVQTAEGGISKIDDMLQRIRELTVSVSNDTNEHNLQGTGDRQKMQDEVNQLVQEIDSISERVEFNKKVLLNGDWAGSGAVGGSTISRLSDALKTADANRETAAAAVKQASKAYEKFTAESTSKFQDALLNYFGNGVGVTNPTGNNAYLAANKDSILSPGGFTAVDWWKDAAVSGGAIGQLNELYQTLADAATAFGTFDGTSSIFLDSSDTAYTEANGAFKVFLSQFGITDSTGWAEICNTADLASAFGDTASISQMLDSDAFKTGAGQPLNAANALDILKKIAAYEGKVTNGGDVAAVVKNAQKVLDALNNISEFMKDGGVFDTAKKTYETAVKTERAMLASVESAVSKLNVAQAQYKKADVELQAGIAKQSASAGQTEGLYFQVGANANQGITMTIGSMKSDVLGIGDGKGNTDINFLKMTGADITGTLSRLDVALSYITTERSKLGAVENRLTYTSESLQISSENLSASESRIRDTDMAKEMMKLTQANILEQAAISMLAQGNQQPQNVLQLLR